MAKKKYYAVRKGIRPGIYQTWDECKKQVDGFPKAEYKGFATLSEAKNYISSISKTNNTIIKKEKKKYYAVKKGLKPGIYDSWEKCKSIVDGFPNAEYKSFTTLEEANDYLFNTPNTSNIVNSSINIQTTNDSSSKIKATSTKTKKCILCNKPIKTEAPLCSICDKKKQDLNNYLIGHLDTPYILSNNLLLTIKQKFPLNKDIFEIIKDNPTIIYNVCEENFSN